MDNEDGFYDNLPMIRPKGRRSKHQLPLTKAQRKNMQIQLYELRQAELASKIAALKGSAEDENEDSGGNDGAG